MVKGSADDIVPFNEALKIKSLIPQAELVSIEGANHYMLIQDGPWQQVAETISKFLS